MITKAFVLIVAVVALVQCSHEPYLTNADSGKVVGERYYEVDGVRKVERRILVATTPRYETRLETQVIGRAW